MKKLFCVFLTALLISTMLLGCSKEETAPEKKQAETTAPVTEAIETTTLAASENGYSETNTIVEMPIDFVVTYLKGGSDSFTYYEVTGDETCVTVSLGMDGVAQHLSDAKDAGNDENYEPWAKMKTQMDDYFADRRKVLNSFGYKDTALKIVVVNATTPEEPLLVVEDGEITFDVMADAQPLEKTENAKTEQQSSDIGSVIYDQNGVTITAKGFEGGSYEQKVLLLVENATDADIAVTGDDFVVNGITVPGSMYIKVAAGKKANDHFSFRSEDLDLCGISKIVSVSTLDARVVNAESYDEIFKVSFEIKEPDADSYIQNIDESGDLLYDENGFTVIAKQVIETNYGPSLILLIKNETDNNILIQAEDVSVNSFMVYGSMSDAVCAGTVSFCDLSLRDDELEENGIKTIEDIAFTLKFLNPDTYSKYAVTNELTVSVK